jgi:hypothetical protein
MHHFALLFLFTRVVNGQGSSVSIVTGYGLGGRGSIPGGGRGFFFYPLRPAGSGAHPACHSWYRGPPRGVMLTTHPLPVPRLRKSRSCISSPPVCHVGTLRDTFTLWCSNSGSCTALETLVWFRHLRFCYTRCIFR